MSAQELTTEEARGLAQRWVKAQCRVCEVLYGRSDICDAVDRFDAVALDESEHAALLGWVRQAIEGCNLRGAATLALDDLGLTFVQALALIEAACPGRWSS